MGVEKGALLWAHKRPLCAWPPGTSPRVQASEEASRLSVRGKGHPGKNPPETFFSLLDPES